MDTVKHRNLMYRSQIGNPNDPYIFFLTNRVVLNRHVKASITKCNSINAKEDPAKYRKSFEKLLKLFQHYHSEHLGNFEKIFKSYSRSKCQVIV